MDGHFRSLNLRSQDENSNSNLLTHYQENFATDALTQQDVSRVLQAIADCMAKGPEFWPERHSPGHNCVLTTLGHIGEAVSRHKEWQQELKSVVWNTFKACFAHGISGFTVDILTQIGRTFPDSKFSEASYAKELLGTIRQVRINQLTSPDDAKYAASELSGFTVTMLKRFEAEILFQSGEEEIQALYLDNAEHCNTVSALTLSYWGSALGCLQRKLENFQSKPLSSSLVHLYAHNEQFVRKLLAAIEPAATQDLSVSATSSLEGVVRSCGSAFSDMKELDFKYIFPDAHRICFKLMANPGTLGAGCYLQFRLYDAIVRNEFPLSVSPSLQEMIRDQTSIEFLLNPAANQGQIDSGSENSDAKHFEDARHQLYYRLMPAAAITADEMALCMPMYLRLLSVSVTEFDCHFREMFLKDGRLEAIQRDGMKFQSALLKFIDACTDSLIKMDASLPDEHRAEPLSESKVVNVLASVFKDIIHELFESPARVMIQERAVQLKLFEVTQKVVSVRSMCLLAAVFGISKECFHWTVVLDQFQDAMETLEGFLTDPMVTIESLHYGNSYVGILLDFVAFAAENSSQSVCDAVERCQRILEICIDRDLIVTDTSGTDAMSVECMVLTRMFTCFTAAANVQSLLTLNTQLYPVYIRMVQKCAEVPETRDTVHPGCLLYCMGHSKETVTHFMPHLPLLLQLLKAEKDAKSTFFATLATCVIQNLNACTQEEVPDEIGIHIGALIDLTKDDAISEAALMPLVTAVCRLNSKYCPELMRDFLLRVLLSSSALRASALCGLDSLAETQQPVMSGCLQQLVDAAKTDYLLTPVINTMELCSFDATRQMTSCCDLVNHHVSRGTAPDRLTTCLELMRRIGVDRPKLLAERESDISRWKLNPALLDACNRLLDVIANESSASSSSDGAAANSAAAAPAAAAAANSTGQRPPLTEKKREKLARVQSAAGRSKTCQML